jgi:hypothetical protein
MRLRQIALAAASFASILGLAAPCFAREPGLAEVLFDRGVEHLEAGHHHRACPAIAESYRLDPRPGALFALAECEAMRGRLATALARYDEYIELYEVLAPELKRKQVERLQTAKAQKDKLAREVPRLTVVMPTGAPKGTVLRIDGARVESRQLGQPLPVDPGSHHVTLTSPGRAVSEVQVKVEKGKAKVTTPPLGKALPPVASEVGPSPRGRSAQWIAGSVLAWTGVVSIGVTGILGAWFLEEYGTGVDGFLPPGPGARSAGDGTSGSSQGLLALLFVAPQTALLLTGAALLATDKPPARLRITTASSPTLRVGLSPLGKQGAFLGLSGTF